MTEQHPAVAWLLAAHSRAEELARAGTPGPWEPEGDDPTDDEVFTVHDGEYGDLVGNPVAYVRSGTWGRPDAGRTRANMQLIASFADPVSVLRRVAAERRILAGHADEVGCCSTCAAWEVQRIDGVSEVVAFDGMSWPCRTVLLLAEAWGWTEDADGR